MPKPNPSDKIEILLKDTEKPIEGILMPRAELLADDILVIKLSNGYNIGIEKKKIAKIKILERYKSVEPEIKDIQQRGNLPKISILHTGGTIASKVDYRTGAVVAKFTPQDIIEMFPELAEIANIKSRLIFQMFSEDFEPEHWGILAKEALDEIKEGAGGVIITHGTDTMAYTSTALSFMLQNLPVPIIIVGSQRSSDRGSSDANLNLVSAVRFIANTDFAGIAVCMHATSSDKFCYIHKGTNVRKMHSSARDAFKSINSKPIAKIFLDGNVEYLIDDYQKKSDNAVILRNNFEKKVAIIKIRPGLNPNELKFFERNNYRGIILEGTGLGHAPVNVRDKYTKHHKRLLQLIRRLSRKMLIAMATQCIYGHVNMNIYSTGRDLLSAGVIPASMMPEVAYVKLGWALGNAKNLENAKELFLKNIVGEISERLNMEY